MAFQDILKDPTKGSSVNNLREVLGLHLYLPQGASQMTGPSAAPRYRLY